MSIEEIKAKLASIAEMNGIGLNVFFLINTNGTQKLKRANIKEDVKTTLITSYKYAITEITSNAELALVNLSAADDRKHALYSYDLEQKPALFNFFDTVMEIKEQSTPDFFSFRQDSLKDLEGYFVFIGDAENNIILFRKQMPINLFQQGKIYLFADDDTQFDSIKKEFLRIDTKIDILSVDNALFVNNITILERHYEFKTIIENEATNTIEKINSLGILENIDVLLENVTNMSFARKLSKISTKSPVFTLPSSTIIGFAKNHATLKTAFKYNETNDKIRLDTKKSQSLFLKLMNDDFLHSELTNYDYMTPAKDKLSQVNTNTLSQTVAQLIPVMAS
jgi:hypothetical protein